MRVNKINPTTSAIEPHPEIECNRRYGLAFDFLVVLALPTVFFFFAPIQRFIPAGWVDAGLYFGLSMDYAHIVKTYGWDYHSLRVSYLIPNVFANILLPPVPARLTVAWAFYITGIVALYGGARNLWGRLPAAMSVSCLAYNPVYLLAATAGYVDGAYIAYTFVLFFVLSNWVKAKNPLWVALAGATAVCGALAHALALAPIGLVFLFFLIKEPQALTKKTGANVSLLVLGGVIAWLFFVVALIKMRFGIKAFSQLGWIVNASLSGFGSKYQFGIKDWLPFTTRLLPGVIAAVALSTAIVGRTGNIKRQDVAAAAVLVLSTVMLPAYDVILGGSTTQSAFYAGLAIPGLMIGIASLAGMTLTGNAKKNLFIYALTTLITIVISWNSSLIYTYIPDKNFVIFSTFMSVCSVILIFFCIKISRPGSRSRAFVLFSLLILCCFSFVINRDTRQLYRTTLSVDNKEYFKGAVFVRNLISPSALQGRRPLFWFDRAEFHTHDGRSRELARRMRFGDSEMTLTYYDTLASLRLWDKSLFAAQLTANQDLSAQPFLSDPNVTLVVVEQDRAKLEFALASLRKANVKCRVRPTSIYRSQSFDMHITLIELNGRDGGGPTDCGSISTSQLGEPPVLSAVLQQHRTD